MSDLRFEGTAWVFGDQVDTDQIVSGRYLDATVDEQSRHVFEALCPQFTSAFEPGGIVVAGANFGCGSSRESAPEALKHRGVAVVVAESFARIFFRNAIAIALPVLVCRGVAGAVTTGDRVEVDVKQACVRSIGSGRTIEGVRLHHFMLQCLEMGGIMKVLQAS